jgi:hypothetical protein
VRQLFKGGNYSREKTINHFEVLTAETIQRRKLFKGGNYMRKYGIPNCWVARLDFIMVGLSSDVLFI